MTTSSKKRREREYQAAIRDVLICSKSELAPFATAFSFPPENFEQQRFGTIFGIIKVDDHSEDSSYVVNLLTSVIKKEYFGKPHRNAEESFEASLRKANLALAELVRHGATGWAGKINFAAGAIERNNLHFSCLGNASIFLIRGGEIAEISAELEEEKEAESHPLKTFSNTSSGKLEIGDKLIFTTHELTDIFSREELRQNASHFSREEFPGFLEISLRANSELAGTIIVDLTDSAEMKPVIVEAPVIGKETVKKIDSFVGTRDIVEKEMQSRDLEHILREEAPVSRESPRKNIFFNFLEKARNIFSSILHSARKINFGHFFAKISSWTRQFLLSIKPVFSFLLLKMKKINWKEKGMLAKIAGGIAVLAIISYVAVAVIKNRNEQRRLAAETAVQPTEPAPVPQNLEDVNVKNIEIVEEVAALSQENIGLAFLDNTLYAISGKNRYITKINIDSKNAEEIKSDISSGNFGLLTAMPHLKALFILTEDRKVITFTPVNKNFQENSISLPANLKARDIKSYLTYLYVLDIGGNQIFRYPRSEGGFGEMQSWLREESDLKNAKGMAINGDLYLAESDKITAYLQGKIDGSINFEKTNVPLAVEKIFSEPDMEGIYILDNRNHRVVKYGKDGKIVSQYWNADISGIRDFSVDEKNKIIYLLQGNKITQFSIK